MKSKKFPAMAAVVGMTALTGCTDRTSASAEPAGDMVSGRGDNYTRGFETTWNPTPDTADASE